MDGGDKFPFGKVSQEFGCLLYLLTGKQPFDDNLYP